MQSICHLQKQGIANTMFKGNPTEDACITKGASGVTLLGLGTCV